MDMIRGIWYTYLSVATIIVSFATWALHPPDIFAQSIPVTPQQIDELSGKSDRWLFIAALVVLLSFGALVVKWLLMQLDRQREANSAMQRELVDYLKTANVEMTSVIKSNQISMENNTDTLEKINMLISNLTSPQQHLPPTH